MSRLKAYWYKIFNILDDMLAYVLTIVGILLSNYLPLLQTKGHISIELDWWRIGIAAVVALMVVGRQEALSVDESGSTDKSKEGRRKRFSLRMANALAHGMAWTQIIQLASN